MACGHRFRFSEKILYISLLQLDLRVYMVADEDTLVLCILQRVLVFSLDRFLTRTHVDRELLGVYVWDFFIS